MNMDRNSGFTFYSIGIVLKDKLRTTNFIQVLPIEAISDFDGDLNNLKQTINSSIVDAKGTPILSKVTSDTYIYADWLPLSNSNRSTSPDVIKNETVMIYRYSDTDKYYWSTMKDEKNIRRLETVRYSYGNKRDPLVAYDSDSSYWFEVSTHDKYIHLHTSDNDGEAAKFDLVIDTKSGKFTFQDNHNNSFVWDSVARELTTISGVKTINMDESVTVNTPVCTVNTQHAVVNSPTTDISGDTNIGGNLTVGGNANIAGTTTSPRFDGVATRADSAATADCC